MSKHMQKECQKTHEGITEYFETLPGYQQQHYVIDCNNQRTNRRNHCSWQKNKERESVEEEITSTKYKPSIQQLLFNKSLEMSDEIDEFVETLMVTKSMLTKFDPQRMLLIVGAKPNHAKLIASMYQPMFDDFNELVNPPSAKEKWMKLKKICITNLKKVIHICLKMI